jgi:hypothetical protein
MGFESKRGSLLALIYPATRRPYESCSSAILMLFSHPVLPDAYPLRFGPVGSYELAGRPSF